MDAAGAPAASAIRVENLRCEYRVNPQGIDLLQPRLSWTLEAAPGARGVAQSAYRVLVASTPEILAGDRGDLWDSGRVEWNRQIHIEYAGKPLVSRARCHWKVRVYDQDGQPSEWSAPAMWFMGLLAPADWQGKWIAATDQPIAPREAVAGYHALEARKADELKWVQVDLGTERVLDEVRLHPPAPSGFEQVKGFGFPLRFRVEASDDPEFRQAQSIADFSQTNYPNPGNESGAFAARGVRGRYVRVTATQLWNRRSGAAPFCFALAELEVMSQGTNAALHAPVRAKDSVEASGWSLKKLTDGKWITAGSKAGPNQPGNAAVLLRREIQLDAPVVRATAFLCGLGYSELYLNGKKVGDHVLDPGFTDYSKRVLYVTYDVSEYLHPGVNAIGVQLGGGWYDPASVSFGIEKGPWIAPLKCLLQLVVELADGSIETTVSDSSWKWSTGAITFNCVIAGETIDTRLDKPGWNRPGYDDSDWKRAMIGEAPAGRLCAQTQPPIRLTRRIKPVGLSEPKPGIFVFDLGVNLAGWARLNTSGPRGQKITLQYNEALNPDGTLHPKYNLDPNRRFQTDEFILSGKGEEVFEPRFTYHGYRYIQVTGLSRKPTRESLIGCWVHTDAQPAGEFVCSNPLINRIQELVLRTYLNNLQSIPTDCPHREKMGWLQDGCVSMEQAVYNFDSPAFYTKWFHDMQDTQEPNGHLSGIAPVGDWGKSGPHGEPDKWTDPWWGSAIVRTPWNLSRFYGDRRVLETGYPAMKKYVEYLGTTTKDHILTWSLGDWLEVGSVYGSRTPIALSSTAAYCLSAQIVSQTGALLAETSDAERYDALARAIARAFNQRFFDNATGRYAQDSQTAQALPLCLGMVPTENRGAALEVLIKNIKETRQGHLSTGIVGTPYLFQALSESGHNDLAYQILTREGFPGWAHMVRQGATTIWEDWAGTSSHDHPALGSVGAWFYQALAGICPDPAAPGFKKIVIKPAVVGDLTWVKGSYDSIHGRIVSNWRREGDQLSMDITIPANTTGTVFVPAEDASGVTESGKPAAQAEGVKLLRLQDHAAVYVVDAGTYQFQSTLPEIIK